MRALLQPIMAVVFFVVVRAGDLAVSHALTRDTLMAVLYGIVALLALIVLIFAVFGVS